jgi:Mg2+ and Co2+ transporter CorA
METVNKALQLDKAIAILEQKQRVELVELKDQINVFYEELKPNNLIKSIFNNVSSSSVLNSNVLNSTLSLASGYISGKLVNNPTNNILKKIAGYGLQYVLTNFIANKINNKS